MHADIVCFNYAISADFPRIATRKVEETLGKDVNCLFIQGASGNMESLLISPRRSGPDDNTAALIKWLVIVQIIDEINGNLC
jgi:neutral ceramidase